MRKDEARRRIIALLEDRVVASVCSQVNPANVQPGAKVEVIQSIDYDEAQLGSAFYDKIKQKLNDRWRHSRRVASIAVVDEAHLQLTFEG